MTESRQPPYSEEAERGVLGAIMLDYRVFDITTDYRLTDEAFCVPAHRFVFKSMMTLHEKSESIDSITVTNQLSSDKVLDKVGGQMFIEGLVESTPTAAHSEYYIKIVAEKWQLREIIRQCRETEAKCFNAAETSPDEIIATQSANFMTIEGRYELEEVTWRETMTESMKRVDQIMDSDNRLAGFSTGYKNIDGSVLGLKDRELTILAARPSQGKTSLAMNISQYVAEGKNETEGRAVGIFSLEMGREELALRMKCAKAGIDNWQLMRGLLSKDKIAWMAEAAKELSKLPIFIDDRAALDIDQIAIKARRWKKKHNIELIVVDYLQLVQCMNKSKQGRQMEVTAISAKLKQIAKELGIPVLALAQLSRKPEDRKDGRPMISDLRESGSIEQDADNVWLMHRPCNYPGSKHYNDTTLAIVDIAKQRNGPIGDVHLTFQKQLTRFDDRVDIKKSKDEFDEFNS
tara:strand:- start:7672 stop:9054 length:1383 start_codon:yes stop_codon:yes gene_type:complete